MKASCVSLLAVLGLLAGHTARAADVKIPIEKYKLRNGLRVILSRDSAVPVAAVYMIFDVGARAEEQGRTGFAHLFEHMMFEGSANAPKGIHSKYIKSNGGFDNGSTHPDYTDYFETLPANKLAVALWLESDRMRSLAINAENLTNQKEAVKQERRLSFDNRPYATAIVDKWPSLAFENWQSSHSLIGSFEDLNSASLEDVAKFFKTYYAPNNAALVIVGDIQIADAKKLVETYFADLPAQQQPKHPDLTEPEKRQVKSEVYKDALAQVPGVIVGYPGPKRRTPDYYAMGMIDVLLTGGESSRLQLDLVKGKQSVVQYEGNLGWPFEDVSDYRDPGIYGLFLLYKPNFKAEQIVAQVQEEIARIQKEGVDLKELERARTFLRSQRIGSLQSALTRAQLLGKYEILDGDPEMINTEMDNYLAVTPAQIQAAANKYMSASKRDMLEIQPAPPAPAASQPAKDTK